MKYTPQAYSSLSKQQLIGAFKRQGIDLFYNIGVDKNKKETREFLPSRLAVYFKKVFHVISIGILVNGVFKGDIYTYDEGQEIHVPEGEYTLAEEITKQTAIKQGMIQVIRQVPGSSNSWTVWEYPEDE